MHPRNFHIWTAASRLENIDEYLASVVCMQIAGFQEKKKWFIAPHILEYWLNIDFFFQMNMLLFATNQTNLKQKQNVSVCSLDKYWNCMHGWHGVFSCILAVHALKEAFSVFIVSCLYLLSIFWLAGKEQTWFPCAFERWVIRGAGRREGRRALDSCWKGLNCKHRAQMLDTNLLGSRRWEQEGGLSAVSTDNRISYYV